MQKLFATTPLRLAWNTLQNIPPPPRYATFRKINTDKKKEKVKFWVFFVTIDYQQMITNKIWLPTKFTEGHRNIGGLSHPLHPTAQSVPDV